jgi:hypothetical protein
MIKESPAADRNITVPVPTPVTQITQAELMDYIALKNEVEQLQTELDTRKENLKSLLCAGAKVEVGVFVASVKTSERTSVSWKSEAESLAEKIYGLGEGEKWSEKVKARTPATTTITLDVH